MALFSWGFYPFSYTILGKVILHMPMKLEHDLMNNEWGVCEKCKWTRDNDNDKQMTMGVTDNIIAALKTNLSYARH